MSTSVAPTGPVHYANDQRNALTGEIVALVKAFIPKGEAVSNGLIQEEARKIAFTYIEAPTTSE